jgi:outer membrane protein
MRSYYFILIVFFCIASNLSAQTLTLTVDDAVGIALKSNLDIKQSEKDLAIAQADLRAAYADLFMPTVQLNGAFSYTDPVSLSNPFNDNYSFGLQITRSLFAGGKYWFAKESKRFAAELAEYKLKDKIREITRTTRISFYNLLLLREKLRIAQENDRSLKGRLESTRINYANGIASELDYLKDQVKYKNNQPLLAQARNNYDIGRINFANSIGLASLSPLEPAGDILDATKLVAVMTEEDKIVEIALANDLSIRSSDYDIAMNEANKASTVAARFPSLSGSFNYGYNYKATPPATDRALVSGWTFTLSCIVPLDPWIPAISKVANQETSADELTAKKKLIREQTLLAIKTKVKTLLMNIKYAEQNIESQRENVTQAKLILAIAGKQYREGTLSALDLSDTEVSYNQATANYLQALYDRFTNMLQLNDMVQ